MIFSLMKFFFRLIVLRWWCELERMKSLLFFSCRQSFERVLFLRLVRPAIACWMSGEISCVVRGFMLWSLAVGTLVPSVWSISLPFWSISLLFWVITPSVWADRPSVWGGMPLFWVLVPSVWVVSTSVWVIIPSLWVLTPSVWVIIPSVWVLTPSFSPISLLVWALSTSFWPISLPGLPFRSVELSLAPSIG